MPSIAVIRLYEAIYIIDPDLNEEQVNTIADRYRHLVETNGGTVERVNIWERRRLAYEIKGHTEGIYIVMQFQGTAKVEAELRRVFQISEDQIRYMIVKPEEVDPLISREESRPAAAEPVPAQAAALEEPVSEAPIVEPAAPEEAEPTSVEPVSEPEIAVAA